MQVVDSTVTPVYCCYYNRDSTEPLRYSRPYSTFEEAERAALRLRLAGYSGAIIRRFESFYDEDGAASHNFDIVDHF